MSAYAELANRINEVYELNLEPHDEGRAFVKIFRKLLTEKEAVLAASLSAALETAEELAVRTGQDSAALGSELCALAKKGILYELHSGRNPAYKLMPFVPGIFEALVGISGDPEIAGYLQEYADEMKVFRQSPEERVIPVNCRIDVETRHAAPGEIELYLNNTDKYALMDCICRTARAANGRACGHPIRDMCVLVGDYADYYVRIGNARRVTKEEVQTVLARAEAAGLFHEIFPIEKSKSVFLCNCCTCGCMFLELAERIRRVLKYESTVRIDGERCTRCGICFDSCPEQVFTWAEDGTGIEIAADRCFCCGLCEMVCTQNAIHAHCASDTGQVL